jgi:hypothetical protein
MAWRAALAPYAKNPPLFGRGVLVLVAGAGFDPAAFRLETCGPVMSALMKPAGASAFVKAIS